MALITLLALASRFDKVFDIISQAILATLALRKVKTRINTNKNQTNFAWIVLIIYGNKIIDLMTNQKLFPIYKNPIYTKIYTQQIPKQLEKNYFSFQTLCDIFLYLMEKNIKMPKILAMALVILSILVF